MPVLPPATRSHEQPARSERAAAAGSPSAPVGAPAVLALQTRAGNRAVARLVGDGPLPSRVVAVPVQRRERGASDADLAGPQDWTTADRTGATARWRTACLTNLTAVDRRQYRRIVERRDFYKWFYEHTVARGYTTRWPLAAWVVANGAHQVADMDEEHETANDTFGLAGVELQGAMREGNQVIFDNVLPKLKRLLDGGPITGRAAMQWDMLVLAEEQALVQPMYARMSREAFEEVDYIARQRRIAGLGAWWTNEGHVPGSRNVREGDVPAFDQPSLSSVEDRWRYGMGLGDRFTPGGTGFDGARDAMPAAGAGYVGGAEFAAADYRRNLHFVDAWLNPNRLSRGPVSNLVAALGRLGDREKRELLADSSPDGWRYSEQLAQWAPTVTEATVVAALPGTPADAAAVNAFVARFRAAVRPLTPVPIWGFPL